MELQRERITNIFIGEQFRFDRKWLRLRIGPNILQGKASKQKGGNKKTSKMTGVRKTSGSKTGKDGNIQFHGWTSNGLHHV